MSQNRKPSFSNQTHSPKFTEKNCYHPILLGGRSGITLLATNLNSIMLQVPLLERRSIDMNNSTLHKSLGPDQLVVESVVDNIKNSGLAGH
ncbi:unnamed protein product [Eruca vesicaria subsp. sativa]|uniref:Uncharacterized protein n=1 Tax=Eruca vesicaria subsp. sativa TaxID=29727 RepID=A0ABC8KK46_ERUVS|nr:unnamed protein product [Eruca vesicaria subsp. sativa]